MSEIEKKNLLERMRFNLIIFIGISFPILLLGQETLLNTVLFIFGNVASPWPSIIYFTISITLLFWVTWINIEKAPDIEIEKYLMLTLFPIIMLVIAILPINYRFFIPACWMGIAISVWSVFFYILITHEKTN